MNESKTVGIHLDPLNPSHIIINVDINCLQQLLIKDTVSYHNSAFKLSFFNPLSLTDRIRLCNWFMRELADVGEITAPMTTNELIEKLKELDPDGTMQVTYGDNIEVEDVIVKEAGNEKWVEII